VSGHEPSAELATAAGDGLVSASPPQASSAPASRRDRCRLGPVGLTVYNLLYWPYLLSSCAVLFVPALLLFLVTFWDPRRRALLLYTSRWGAHYLSRAPYAGVSVRGKDKLRGIGACVYVSNHQSMVDILAAFATHLPYMWISKKENFYVPFLGWNMWLSGYVPLKRGRLRSILGMVRLSLKKLSAGNSLFVFPEGTRSLDGNLRTFHRGAFWLAARNRVPIVPIVIEGTDRILPKGSFHIAPQPVVVSILDPVDPSVTAFDDRALCVEVRKRMAAELARLRHRPEPAPLDA
jgi:1-acyl-sn-glycerol-3-phosphate acyltransferase